ncbi:MAG: hypothetical protein NTV03_01090, partial [Candidatus Nomurabacteria bacterium]|nr:hypothetical protein [Candidatus Nomurabacteria bacterium]
MKFKHEILAALIGVAGATEVNANIAKGGEKNTGETKTTTEAPASTTKSGVEKSDAREAVVNLEASTRFTQLDLTSFFETD